MGWASRPVRPIADAVLLTLGYALTVAGWAALEQRALERRPGAEPHKGAGFPPVGGGRYLGATSLILFLVTGAYLMRLRRSEDGFLEAQAELRAKELAVRQGYVDVLDAVTGGKLILITMGELDSALGDVVSPPHPLLDASEVSTARKNIADAISDLPVPDPDALILAVSEALTNAVKHGTTGKYAVYRSGHCLQIAVSDRGPGIDFRSLPKATLIQGFSTTSTLGLGFTIMLEICDRVLLTTGDGGGTVVVLEVELVHAEGDQQPGDRTLVAIVG